MNDESINRQARLAFGIVVAVALVASLAWYLGSEAQYTRYRIYTHDPVSGLIADAPVEFHGVDVGKVRSVELVNPGLVAISLDVRSTAPVSAATVATITSRGVATRGFTGYVSISLEDAGKGAQPLRATPGEPYPVIAAAPSRVVSLDMTLGQVNDNVETLTRLVQSVLDARTVASLKQSVDSLQLITKTLADNNKRLGTIIVKGEEASREIKPLLESSNNMVSALQTQVLPEAYKTLSKLDALTGSLGGAAAKIERDPSVVLRGVKAQPPGPGETK